MTKKIHSDDDRPIDDEDMPEEHSPEYFMRLHHVVVRARANDTTHQYGRLLDVLKAEPAMQKPTPQSASADVDGEKEMTEEQRDDVHALGEKDGKLLAQIYGNRDELPHLGDYLVEAVSTCRMDAQNRRPCASDPSDDADDEEIAIADTKDTVQIVGDENGLSYTVGDEPLTADESEVYEQRMSEPNIPLDMWMQAAGIDPVKLRKDVEDDSKFDEVNKSKHYNLHPSGVECIELAEKMSFNLGNAFKYVFRRNIKASALLDLRKAEYYLKREIGRIKQLCETLPSCGPTLYLHPMLTRGDNGKIRAITVTEPNLQALNFYTYLFANPSIDEAAYNLGLAHDALRNLIDAEERNTPNAPQAT